MDERLFKAATQAMALAHAPYSHFPVGAAILADNGGVYAGCNVENASYPEGICAETAAIAAMVMAGGRRILEIAVIGKGATPITPCGGCRQRIREFAGPEVRVHSCGPEGYRSSFTLGELLPHAFGPEPMA
jgi:cytidine deaminase